MHILVTNDDGVFAPGIVALAEALSKIARVTIIAPDRNQSGVSSAISLETPLRVMKLPKDNWYQLNGTPADCVKLALSGFMTELPDMVVSGINAGANLGDDVIYSGTVAAAIEGRFLRLPSMAISSTGKVEMNYDCAAQVAVQLVKRINELPLASGLIFNVNVPPVPYEQLQGIRITSQGERHFTEPLMPTLDGRNKRIYWLGEPGRIKDDSEGTDFHAVKNGYAAVTPMQIDMTARDRLEQVKNWLTTPLNRTT